MVSQNDKMAFQGAFDGVEGNVVRGWAKDDTPGPLELIIRIDGADVGVTIANQEREDLAAVGHGNCAFSFEIPSIWHDGTIHTIEITQAGDETSLFEIDEFIIQPLAGSEASGTNSRVTEAPSPFVVGGRDVAISVLLPTFNRAEVLEHTARDLLRTIGSDPVELVVVDDGSQDSTPDILRVLLAEFGSSKLRYSSIENGGPGNARNIAASMAEGDLLLFVGDDTRPTTSDLFKAHYQAHTAHPAPSKAVLGKIVWPDDRFNIPNLVMSLIQGDGQQQFGFKHMRPWQFYNHWIFYTANVSVKSNIINDWSTDGFSPDFTLAAFEDAEFAYRMSRKYDDFGIFYTPNAVVEHHHPYDVAGFMRRQVSCGMMMDVLLKKHPELSENLLGPDLHSILMNKDAGSNRQHPSNYYSSMIEGLRAWVLVLDEHYGLGSQNWHAEIISAVFRLSLLDGYLILQRDNPTTQAAAYRFLIEQFRTDIGRSVSHEILGEIPSFGLV